LSQGVIEAPANRKFRETVTANVHSLDRYGALKKTQHE